MPADVPDAALVAPCDTTNGDPGTNRELVKELLHVRRQRNECAAQVDGTHAWRDGALKRAAGPTKGDK